MQPVHRSGTMFSAFVIALLLHERYRDGGVRLSYTSHGAGKLAPIPLAS